MDPARGIVTLAGLVLIALVNWWFFGVRRKQ
jgi:plastocyanin domain-containing protein